jgi:hypothetical protein
VEQEEIYISRPQLPNEFAVVTKRLRKIDSAASKIDLAVREQLLDERKNRRFVESKGF